MITSRLIGKLGGAEMEVVPFDISGTQAFIHQVDVPDGAEMVVAIEINLTSADSVNIRKLELRAGGGLIYDRMDVGVHSMVRSVGGDIEVRLSGSGSNAAHGNLYIAPLPD